MLDISHFWHDWGLQAQSNAAEVFNYCDFGGQWQIFLPVNSGGVCRIDGLSSSEVTNLVDDDHVDEDDDEGLMRRMVSDQATFYCRRGARSLLSGRTMGHEDDHSVHCKHRYFVLQNGPFATFLARWEAQQGDDGTTHSLYHAAAAA